MKMVMLVLSLLAASNASAQVMTLVPVGAGGRSCGEWLSVHESQHHSDENTLKAAMLISWVQDVIDVQQS
jgi:hypothetical protein